MKLQSFRRLFSSDYNAQYKDLLDSLSGTINSGIEALYNALNNNLTLADNLACTVGTITVSVDAKGVPTNTITLKLANTLTVQGVLALSVVDNTNSASFPLGGVTISYTINGQTINITNITGLIVGHSYNIKVVVFN